MGDETPDETHPDQRELELEAPAPVPVASRGPWQVEAVYRMGLNTTVVAASMLAQRFLIWTVGALGFAETPTVARILMIIINVATVLLAGTMVVFDTTRFLYRRAPEKWRQKIGW